MENIWMDATQVEIDGVNRSILFRGTCIEMLPICRAMCCREWDVTISYDEYVSGQYEAETACVLTNKPCRDTSQPCLSRWYRLSKHDDKSCIYLKDDLCSIYSVRPNTCREFQCKRGWHLDTTIHTIDDKVDKAPVTISEETFAEKVNVDSIFVLHPLLKLNMVIYLRSKKRIIFVKEMAGSCNKFTTQDHFDHPQLDDTKLSLLIEFFARKETLENTHARFCSETKIDLPLHEFLVIVWTFNKHNIILDSRNFQGMLSGMQLIA
jgi:Fe-S-cluster containining protein